MFKHSAAPLRPSDFITGFFVGGRPMKIMFVSVAERTTDRHPQSDEQNGAPS
jgi:hypothetical protein